MTMTIRKQIDIELTNQEIGDLVYRHGRGDETANILNEFVELIKVPSRFAQVIATYLNEPACEFFKELANDIKIKESQEEEDEEESDESKVRRRVHENIAKLERLQQEAEEDDEPIPDDTFQANLIHKFLYIVTSSDRSKDTEKQIEKVKELLALGLDINYRPPNDRTNFSAAYICALYEATEVLKYLISVGLDISIPCSISQGSETAIVCARRQNHKEIIEILEAAQKPVEAVEEPEEEAESTEKFYKVGDRFVLTTDSDCYPNGDTFEIISATENSVSFRKIDGNCQHWGNDVQNRETPVTDKNKITEAEWECITDNMASSFTKIEAEPKEEPEEKEEETFYHLGQKFGSDIMTAQYTLRQFWDFSNLHAVITEPYAWLICDEDEDAAVWSTAQRVKNLNKITSEEFAKITGGEPFTLITQEEANTIIAASE